MWPNSIFVGANAQGSELIGAIGVYQQEYGRLLKSVALVTNATGRPVIISGSAPA
jgi:hypothetical protein